MYCYPTCHHFPVTYIQMAYTRDQFLHWLLISHWALANNGKWTNRSGNWQACVVVYCFLFHLDEMLCYHQAHINAQCSLGMFNCHLLVWSTVCTGLLKDQPPYKCVLSKLWILVSSFIPGTPPPDQGSILHHQELETLTTKFWNNNLNKRDLDNSSIENWHFTASSRIGRGNHLWHVCNLLHLQNHSFIF